METVKRARRTGVVSVGIANGRPVSREVMNRRKNEEAWDVRWYNFRDQKWEREGERVTYRQAYNRAYNLTKTNPYAKIGVVLLPGIAPKNGTSPKVETDA